MSQFPRPRMQEIGRSADAPLPHDAQRSEEEKYAWECAENMRGWALRAEEKNRTLHDVTSVILRERERIQSHRESLLIAAQRLLSEWSASDMTSPALEKKLGELNDVVAAVREDIHGS